MIYRVEIDAAAAKELSKLDRQTGRRVADRIRALATAPRPAGCKPLTGQPGLWRIRIGDQRVVYSIDDGVLTILVLRIRHRREAYRKL